MTDYLDINETDKILKTGTGSGYQTAILALPGRDVYTIETVPELLSHATKIINSIGIKNINFLHGNGYNGWETEHPFDKIILTCSPKKIPETLIRQLTENGKLILPAGNHCVSSQMRTET